MIQDSVIQNWIDSENHFIEKQILNPVSQEFQSLDKKSQPQLQTNLQEQSLSNKSDKSPGSKQKVQQQNQTFGNFFSRPKQPTDNLSSQSQENSVNQSEFTQLSKGFIEGLNRNLQTIEEQQSAALLRALQEFRILQNQYKVRQESMASQRIAFQQDWYSKVLSILFPPLPIFTQPKSFKENFIDFVKSSALTAYRYSFLALPLFLWLLEGAYKRGSTLISVPILVVLTPLLILYGLYIHNQQLRAIFSSDDVDILNNYTWEKEVKLGRTIKLQESRKRVSMSQEDQNKLQWCTQRLNEMDVALFGEKKQLSHQRSDFDYQGQDPKDILQRICARLGLQCFQHYNPDQLVQKVNQLQQILSL